MFSINYNLSSRFAMRSLNDTQDALALTVQRLATGLRINSARDDPAGVAISERLKAQINGLNVAARNVNDAISMAQLGDSAAASVVDALQRMREIAVQASNATLTSSDRSDLEQEFDALQSEISSVISGSDFNDIPLLSGSTGTSIQVGANAGESLTVTSASLSSLTGTGSVTASTTTVSGATGSNATSAISALDDAIDTATSARATWGAYENRLERAYANITANADSLSTARGRIVDADYAVESANRVRLTVLQEASIALLAQANASPLKVLSLLTT